nr:MAG TPA: hypothetical protein [Caudoviricetes sp.]DAQ80219.1 MAG TPA: hypothetical protein [Caudoviricetes sp.]
MGAGKGNRSRTVRRFCVLFGSFLLILVKPAKYSGFYITVVPEE